MGYTNSSLVTYKKISPNKTSPRNHVIDTITIHCMAGNLSLESCGSLFAKSSTQASSNYGIDSNGKIALYVEEKDRSWASSNKSNDNRAVTIEVANDGTANNGWHVSDKAMSSLINLITDICKRNNIKELKWSTNKNERINHLNGCNMTVHRDYAVKACPGDYLYGKHSYIASEVNKKLNLKNTSTSTSKSSTSTKVTTSSTTYTQKNFISDVCKILGVKTAKEALTKTVTLSKTTNSKHALVLPVQKYLKSLGYYAGTPDKNYGTLSANATKLYQKNVVKATGNNVDGVISAKAATWKKLLGL